MLSADNAAIVLALSTSIIGIAVTLGLFLLGVRHVQHLSELRRYRDEADEFIKKYHAQVQENKNLLERLGMGFQIQLRLRASLDCKKEFTEKVIQIENGNLMKNPRWSSPEMLERLKEEIARFDRQVRAREIELSVLASKKHDVLAYLQGLARTDGDPQTLEFFQRLIGLYHHEPEFRDQILVLNGLLISRLSIRAGSI